MGKETKTNAMRILDRHKIPYELFQYECEDLWMESMWQIKMVYRENSLSRRW